jgi:hypothetical protein
MALLQSTRCKLGATVATIGGVGASRARGLTKGGYRRVSCHASIQPEHGAYQFPTPSYRRAVVGHLAVRRV